MNAPFSLLVKIDRWIQHLVDEAAFAVMRTLGVRKIRLLQAVWTVALIGLIGQITRYVFHGNLMDKTFGIFIALVGVVAFTVMFWLSNPTDDGADIAGLIEEPCRKKNPFVALAKIASPIIVAIETLGLFVPCQDALRYGAAVDLQNHLADILLVGGVFIWLYLENTPPTAPEKQEHAVLAPHPAT